MSFLKGVVASARQGTVLLPVLQQFLDKEEILSNEEDGHHVNVVKRDAILSIRALRERYSEYNHRKPGEYADYFHPSALGACMRQLWFDKFNAPRDRRHKDDVLKSYLTFEFGSYIHLIIQNLCDRAGVLRQREFEVLDHNLKIVGHGDGVVQPERKGALYLLEIKTVNSGRFTQIQKQPDFGNKQQAHAYMYVRGLKHGVFLYVDKDRSRIKEHVIEYDPELFEVHVRQRIVKYRKHCKNRTVPDKEGSSPRVFPCSFCPFTSTCFTPENLKRFQRKLENES